MKLNTIHLLMAGLLTLVTMAIGCGDTSNKPVGMVVIYEIVPDKAPPKVKQPIGDILKAMAAVHGRLNLNGRKTGRIQQLDDKRFEVYIFRTDPEQMQRIADWIPRPGILEFRILANDCDHTMLIERAKAEPAGRRLRNDSGKVLAWWVPVQENAEKRFSARKDIATRTVTKDDRKVLEVLVVNDPYNVTGEYLKRATVDKDDTGRPCMALSFVSSGAKRLGGLTGDNLPDEVAGFYRTLGIILDGELYSSPRIAGKISKRCQICGDFTSQEVQDVVDLLNAGTLPVAIRKVEQRTVNIEKQPPP